MSSGDTHDTVPLPEWAQESSPPKRRRRPWRPVIVVLILIALLAAAWFAAEWIARGIVERTVRQQVVTNLELPADHPVEVEVEGAVLPQLIAGRLDEIRLASDDVTLGPLTGDVTAEARGIAVRGEQVADAASATVTLDEANLRALMATVDGFPADTLGLDAPNVTMSTDLQFFGATVPVGVALTPSVGPDGEFVLTPASVHVAGADVSADDLRHQFGIASNLVLRNWGVCIREYVPAGVTLSGVHVDGERLVAGFAVNGRIAADPTLQEPGTC